MKVELLDTTLRDGAQMQGISFSVEDKLKIAQCLDELGIPYIEAGNPGSNRKDMEFFERAAPREFTCASLVAFGSTRRAGVRAEDDGNLESVLRSGAPYAALFGKCWDYHVREVLKTTNQENLRMIESSVRFLVNRGVRVIFDAEHFFDGYAENPEYAAACLEAAREAGAETLCLCDTNGGAFPSFVARATADIVSRFSGVKVGIHCHNDGGMAVANTIMAVEAGAVHVQGTVNGYGERCGNADLCAVIPNIQLKMGLCCIAPEKLALLSEVSRKISEISNIPHDETAPYVGGHAFAHKGGMHIDAVGKSTPSFEHISPEAVGNARHFLMSEVSGRSYLLRKLRQVVPEIQKDSPIARKVAERLKELEFEGYQYEGAETSFELEIKKLLGKYEPFFELVEFKVIVNEPSVDGVGCSALIKIRVNGQEDITADEGDGPVDALDRAIRKAMIHFYPQIARMKLTDYKVRVIDSGAATAAKVRVLIESTDGTDRWTTIGVSTDIILASWKALVDSMEYMLLK
jgi:2-isopropylmalate synthase